MLLKLLNTAEIHIKGERGARNRAGVVCSEEINTSDRSKPVDIGRGFQPWLQKNLSMSAKKLPASLLSNPGEGLKETETLGERGQGLVTGLGRSG